MDKHTFLLTDRCRFHLGDEPDAWQAWFNDSDWKEVTLPHDWSVTLPFSREYSSGTGYLAGGIGWYRLRIAPRDEWRGKRISITFDGVYKNSRVWCNSYYLGERPNGYISFTYDITEQFRFDSDNVIAIFVDRREIADSRWFTGSGITRRVTLTVQEAVHAATDGIFFATPQVSEEAACFTVENEIANDGEKEQAVTVINSLYASDGHLAAQAEACASIPAGETLLFKTVGTVESPALWSPETPSLYTLVTSLKTGSGQDSEVYLTDTKKVGIRTFRFDADNGFFLNEKPMTFKGVCVHHDAGCLGAAVFACVWERRLKKLKAMGCNSIRMSHNPHMPQLYDLCDSMGFLVMDEAFDEWEGPKNKWSTGHNVYPPKHQGYYTAFPAWHERDLTDMIRRDRNHPSVILWSIGNEIDYPNDPYCHPSFTTMTGNNDANKPAQERQYNPERPNAERLAILAAHLSEIVRKTDLTHPVTLAAAFPELSAKLGFLDSLDVAGFNYKEHLYEETHAAFPDKPLLGSENGHTLAAWKAVTDNRYISGQFLWTGIDYLGEAHGWPIHGSGAGLLTLAGFEKTSYYRRQSFWSEEPMIHLASISLQDPALEGCTDVKKAEFLPVSECWNYRKGEKVLVKCYTNRKKAAFFLNGESLGILEKDPDCDCITLTVPFAPGTLMAKTVEEAPLTSVSHSLHTTGTACQMELSAEEIASHEEPALYQVEVTMLDTDGQRVYSDSTCLTVTVENGRLLGLENGDLSDVTDYSSSSRRAYRGQLLIYAAPYDEKEPVTVRVTGDHIAPEKIELKKKAE